MNKDFWIKKWEKNEIGFHEGEPNALLVDCFGSLSLMAGNRIFLPLCGKTRDIAWLLSKNYRVAGIELSKMAVDQLFLELDIEPDITDVGSLKHYSATNIDIFLGDIFDLSSSVLGPIDFTYDRAALVALPEEMRSRYSPHLFEITNGSCQLLLCFEYDQNVMEGPPHSIDANEVRRLNESRYDIRMLVSNDVPGGLKGKCEATETAWLLKPKT